MDSSLKATLQTYQEFLVTQHHDASSITTAIRLIERQEQALLDIEIDLRKCLERSGTRWMMWGKAKWSLAFAAMIERIRDGN